MAVPVKDSLLVPFSANFSARLTASAATFGFSSGQATALAALDLAFAEAYAAMMAARSAGDRSKSLTDTKNSTKIALLPTLRAYYQQVQGSVVVTDSNKTLLGVLIPSNSRTPDPVPGMSPAVTVLSAIGRTVRVRLSDSEEPDRKGRPPRTDGIAVFSYVGPTPPAELSDWTFQGNSGRSILSITFDASVPNGSTVYLTAFYFNGSKQSGVACDPVAVFLPGGGVVSSAA